MFHVDETASISLKKINNNCLNDNEKLKHNYRIKQSDSS